MTETTLFDQAKEFVTRGIAAQRAVNKLCHRNDPQTSRDAAEKIIKSGKLNKQEREVYGVIGATPGSAMPSFDFTAKELNHYGGTNYYTIQRRLSGLHNKGKIERTGEKRDGCMVWRLTGRKS